MENVVEMISDEHPGELDLATAAEVGTLRMESVELGTLRIESADANVGEPNELNNVVKDSEAVNVFEESENFYTPHHHKSVDTQENLDTSHHHRSFDSQESFYTPHHHKSFDGQESPFAGVKNGDSIFPEGIYLGEVAEEFRGNEVLVSDQNPEVKEPVDPEKVDESARVQVNDQSFFEPVELVVDEKIDTVVSSWSPEAQETVSFEENGVLEEGNGKEVKKPIDSEKVDQSTRVQVNDQSPFEQEELAVDEKIDTMVSSWSPEAQETVSSEENGVLEEGDVKRVVLAEVNGMEEDGEIDGEKASEDGQRKLVGEKTDNGEYHRAVPDGDHLVLLEQNENREPVHSTFDETNVKNVAESEEQVALGGVPELQDVSVSIDASSNGQPKKMQVEPVHPEFDPSESNHGSKARTYASVVKDGASEDLMKLGEIKKSNSGSNSEVRGDSQDPVVIEDLGESSSTEDDDENNQTSSQPAPSTTSPLESSAGPSLPSRPAGLGSSAPLLEPASRSLQQPRANGAVPQRQSQPSEDSANDESEEHDETREKLQMIRVKFLRLAHRLGQTPHNVVVAQVLYRLGLAEQLRRNTNRPGVFSFDRASVMAEQLEGAGQEPLDFSCTIMVIGKSGVGKSATINSIFDEVKFQTNAFQLGTKKVQDIVGTVQGIKVRVIDTPGLFTSSSDQQRNEKILRSVKRFINKTPPDIVLYFDRLDMQSRDYGDLPLLRTVTDIFGASIWFNAIVVLTHAASAPPDGPTGSPLSYEMFVTQRSHVVQQAIRQAAGDVRLMNPVSLVENHSACRTNRAGQRVLPNGQVWKPHLLLLSFASKILAEANMLLKLQDNPPGKPFGSRARVPPLPFLLSSLLQSRPQLKLPEEQFGDDDGIGEELDEASDSDDGSDYDELPPFKRLSKSQLAKLSKAQKKSYFEELDYREKLFFKKQLKEEKKRRKFMKKMAEAAKDLPDNYNTENVEDESSGPASVPVPMPDLVLPTSFDSDNPSHRYRFLDTSNQWLVRPVLETQGWDHDVGYEGLNVERLFVVKDKVPVSVSGQLTKDKKECTLQMELASSIKHSEAGATSLGLDMQTVGKDMAYTLRGETRIKNFRRNNTAAGVSVTLLGDAMSAGMKIEDKLAVNKRFRLLMSGGAMTGRGDVAYGGRLEATLRDKDYPIGRTLSTLALSVVDWHGDLAIGCNVQSQLPLGRGTNVIGHANLSNRGTGQVGIRLNSSEQIQIALLAFVPVFQNVKRMLFGSSQSM